MLDSSWAGRTSAPSRVNTITSTPGTEPGGAAWKQKKLKGKLVQINPSWAVFGSLKWEGKIWKLLSQDFWRLELKVLLNSTGSKVIFPSKITAEPKAPAGGEQCPHVHGNVSQAAGLEPWPAPAHRWTLHTSPLTTLLAPSLPEASPQKGHLLKRAVIKLWQAPCCWYIAKTHTWCMGYFCRLWSADQNQQSHFSRIRTADGADQVWWALQAQHPVSILSASNCSKFHSQSIL